MRTIHVLIMSAAMIVAGIVFSMAQTGAYSPDSMPGCLVVGSAPTYTAGQRVMITCNTSGQVRMSTTP